MLGIFANNPDYAFTLNNFAFVANFFDGRLYFHFYYLQIETGLPLGFLFSSVCYPSLGQVVDGNLHRYPVAGKNSNVMHTHFT